MSVLNVVSTFLLKISYSHKSCKLRCEHWVPHIVISRNWHIELAKSYWRAHSMSFIEAKFCNYLWLINLIIPRCPAIDLAKMRSIVKPPKMPWSLALRHRKPYLWVFCKSNKIIICVKCSPLKLAAQFATRHARPQKISNKKCHFLSNRIFARWFISFMILWTWHLWCQNSLISPLIRFTCPKHIITYLFYFMNHNYFVHNPTKVSNIYLQTSLLILLPFYCRSSINQC